MKLSLCGINYKSSSLHEREPLQINRSELPQAVKACMNIDGVLETVILTTCNRVEFYLVLDDSVMVFDAVTQFYRQWRKLEIEEKRTSFRTYQGSSVARHLFKVTSGMESMVAGETQIQGQVKEAYRMACSVQAAGKILHKLFHFAFRASKKIRSETQIGKGTVSVGNAALEMIESHLRDENARFLCVGVSPMTELAIAALQNQGITNITLANRTEYKAQKIANRFGVNYIGLEALNEELRIASIVLSATGSELPVINMEKHAAALEDRKGAEIAFIDMALPRDVDPEISGIDGVMVYDLEDIKYYTSQNEKSRREAFPEAYNIAEEFVSEFMAWKRNSVLEPLIKELFDEVEIIRLRELDEAKRKIPPEQWDELERLSQILMKKTIDIPIRQLKELNETAQTATPVELFRRLFKLKSTPQTID